MSRAPLKLVRQGTSELDVVKAAHLLATFKTIDLVKEFHDVALAAERLVKARGAGLEARNDAAAIIIMCEHRLGELLKEQPKAQGTRNRGTAPRKARVLGGSGSEPPTLEELGLDKKLAARCQRLADAPKATLEAHIASVCERSEKLTTSGAIAAVSHGEDYDSDEYYTPEEYVASGRSALGGDFDLDVASSAKANETVRAKKYFSKSDSALSDKNRIWRARRAWFQPPYSITGDFVDRLIWNLEVGATVRSAICLLNADTGTKWFHALAARGPMCLTKGRIGFIRPDGKRLEGNRMAQVIFGVGAELDESKFRAAFAQYGAIGRLEVA